MKIGLIGNGSWATALAKILSDNGHQIDWWMRNENSARYIQNKGHNPDYLSTVFFRSETVYPTNNLLAVINQNDIILFCTPSAYIISVLEQLPKDALHNKTVISAIKGIILGENILLNEYLHNRFNVPGSNYVSITGPCHAEEVALERLSYLTFSGHNAETTNTISELFASEYINTIINADVNGAQYAAVLKNIYAIGAGIAGGLGYGDNFLSVYVTGCYNEMSGFLMHLATSKDINYSTSAYLGDLLVTCYSPHSRNRTFGTLVGKGFYARNASAEMNMVAEGYHAIEGMKAITNREKKALPILDNIYSILKAGLPCQEGFVAIEGVLK